jgi:hypothetical protein
MMSSAASTTQDVSPPRRFIFNEVDMDAFRRSKAKKELLGLVQAMGKSCEAEALDDYDPAAKLRHLSPAMACLHGSLTQMEEWLQEIPPDQKLQARFGNPAFRQWHGRLKGRSKSIVMALLDCQRQYPPKDNDQDYDDETLDLCSRKGAEAAASDSIADVPETDEKLVVELTAYLHDAFGHPVRLDYGTGHESSFMVFLYALCKKNCFGNTPDEPPSRQCLKSVALAIFSQYLRVTRGLQTEYMLEPAGSHGVWGLDDYHCLPFYFGACQLVPVTDYTPNSIHDVSTLQHESERYMYFSCIRYIRELKRNVPFFESSPILNDISALPTWSKVSNGLLKLYEGEVLDKSQVVQHFVFGNIFQGMHVSLVLCLWSALSSSCSKRKRLMAHHFFSLLFLYGSDLGSFGGSPGGATRAVS